MNRTFYFGSGKKDKTLAQVMDEVEQLDKLDKQIGEGFDAEFKPGRERSKEIAQDCAEAVMSASDEDLGDFKEV